ncbi:MAG: hypothetical protein ACLFUB_21440 [Cyclobacteriaceae bacterium]
MRYSLFHPAIFRKGQIIYLSKTFEGSVHDKKMYDLPEFKFLDQWHCLWVDLGFLGIEAEGVEVFMPEKKPKAKAAREKNSPTYKKSLIRSLQVLGLGPSMQLQV